MIPSRFSPSSPKPKQSVQNKESGLNQADSRSTPSSSPRGARPSEPGLKRTGSLPARLPSDPLQRAEVKPDRQPLSRPKPDERPPESFLDDPQLTKLALDMMKKYSELPKFKKELKDIKDGFLEKYTGSYLKRNYLLLASEKVFSERYSHLKKMIATDKEYMEILRSRHPHFKDYSEEQKDKAMSVFSGHPRFQAELAHVRNKKVAIPSGPTSTRKMQPEEQKFLTNAFQEINEEIQDHPFHMHGEMVLNGDINGQIKNAKYYQRGPVDPPVFDGDRHLLISNPPFGGPSDSAGKFDYHLVSGIAYHLYENLKMNTYVTNGKDALHLVPYSLEVVKLVPDPKLEKKLGKFPVAFQVPDPQQPPYPFSHHEAPGSFKPWDPAPRSTASQAPAEQPAPADQSGEAQLSRSARRRNRGKAAAATASQTPAAASAPQAATSPSAPQSPSKSPVPQSPVKSPSSPSPSTSSASQAFAESSSLQSPWDTPSSSHGGGSPHSPSDSLSWNRTEESSSPVARVRRQPAEGRQRRERNAPNRAEASSAAAGPSTPKGPVPTGWSLDNVRPRYEGQLSQTARTKAQVFQNYIRQGYAPADAASLLGPGNGFKPLNALTQQFEIRLNQHDRLTFLSDAKTKTVTILEIGGHT